MSTETPTKKSSKPEPLQLTEGKMSKGGQNPPNLSMTRPPAPQGSGGQSPEESEGHPDLTDAEVIRSSVEDYRAYAAQVMTGPELKADVDRNCKRLLEIAKRLDEPSKPAESTERIVEGVENKLAGKVLGEEAEETGCPHTTEPPD